MARMIRMEATGPHRIDPQDKPVFICMCGLSRNLPFCDGCHKDVRSEEPGTVYVYDAARERVVREEPDADGG